VEDDDSGSSNCGLPRGEENRKRMRAPSEEDTGTEQAESESFEEHRRPDIPEGWEISSTDEVNTDPGSDNFGLPMEPRPWGEEGEEESAGEGEETATSEREEHEDELPRGMDDQSAEEAQAGTRSFSGA
jgi:hypothetical protein